MACFPFYVCGKNVAGGYTNSQRFASYDNCISQRLECPSLLLPVQQTDEPRKTRMKEKNVSFLGLLGFWSLSCKTVQRIYVSLRINSVLFLALMCQFQTTVRKDLGEQRI